MEILTLFALASLFASGSTANDEVTITEENWKIILGGEWMIKFYAPWCPACRALETVWGEFATWAKKRDVEVGSIDVTQQAGLNGRFLITALPTIYHVKDGEFRQYVGTRGKEDFESYIQEQQWKEVSPMSPWKSPDSMLMGGMSKIFGLSMQLKAFHEKLNDEYGFPQWAVILLLGTLVIALGLILGIVMVLISDYMWSGPAGEPRPSRPADDTDTDDAGQTGDEGVSPEPVVDTSEPADDDDDGDVSTPPVDEVIQTKEEDSESNLRQRRKTSEDVPTEVQESPKENGGLKDD